MTNMSDLFKRIDEDPKPPEQDWSKPSLAVVACDGHGHGCILSTAGPHVAHEISVIGRELSDLGLDDAPEGLSVWKGRIKTSTSYEGEVDAWLEGEFRDPTDEEWVAIRNGECPWSESNWNLVEPSR